MMSRRYSIITFIVILIVIVNVTYKWHNLQHNNKSKPAIRRHLPLKKIVLWNVYFSSSTWNIHFPKSLKKEISCPSRNKCILSINRTNPLDYDALVFHGRNGQNPPRKRLPHQIYVMYLWESPVYRGNHFIKGNYYNWTATYHRKSEIVMKHSQWFKLPQRSPDAVKALVTLHKNRKKGSPTVAWIVSHCSPASHRKNYVAELARHIGIDTFGACGKKCHAGNSIACYRAISAIGQYKFYLAFENSICQDYISNKPFRALNTTMVPIVLGGTGFDDYFGLMPPNAYIDVRNFTSPKHLAKYLQHLDEHDEEYYAYHAWRTDYYVTFDYDAWCPICDGLYNKTVMKPRSVNWGTFWNPSTKCDANYVKKLLAGKKT